MSDSSYFYGIGDEVIISLIFGSIIIVIVAYFSYRYHIYQQQLIRNISNNAQYARPQRIYNTDQCPICLGPHRYPVETNCGHKFCGSCLKNYLENRPTDSSFSPFGSTVSCPMCRQHVTLLLVCFSQDASDGDTVERSVVETMAYEFNIRYGTGPRTLISYIRDFPVLFRHLVSELLSYGNLMWVFKIRVFLCLLVSILYFILPSDIFPEAIFGFVGFLDDMIIFFLCAIYASHIYRQFLVNQALGHTETT